MAIVATGSTHCQPLAHRCWRPSAQPTPRSARCKQLSRCGRPTQRPTRSCTWRTQAEESSAAHDSDSAAAPGAPAPRDDDVCVHHEAVTSCHVQVTAHSMRLLPQVLPDSLADALQQASESTALAIQKGAGRCLVRIYSTHS